MVAWIVLCTIWFNFVLGALIPITPKLNEEMAGLAFSSFALIKILALIPAGWIGDRIGHFTAFFIALAAQIVTLALILLFPDLVWMARSTEGITLAFGTISALALLRKYAVDAKAFGKSISLMMGIGSSGFLLGPFFGYNVGVTMALQILFVGSVVMCILHWVLYKKHLGQIKNLVLESTQAGRFPWILVLCFGLVKGLGVGTQPLLGWWATSIIGLPAKLAGLTFVAAAMGFMLGNIRPRWGQATFGILGLILVELSLQGRSMLWWPGLFCLGLFSGTSINLCLSRLGWNKPENLGSQNSKWLALSDIPMMLTPALLWSLREPEQWPVRMTFLMSTLLLALFLMRKRVQSE